MPLQTCALPIRSEEHTSELQHTIISYAVFCLKKKDTERPPRRRPRPSSTPQSQRPTRRPRPHDAVGAAAHPDEGQVHAEPPLFVFFFFSEQEPAGNNPFSHPAVLRV